MLTRVLAAGLLAGVIAGLFVSALQHVTTVPLILKAETYEKAPEPSGHKHSLYQGFGEARLILAHATEKPAAAPGGEAEAEAWAPEDGIERTAYTTLATIGASAGFALMLLAAMLATGAEINARNAALWGVAGFIATGLAPAMGLPPELPGSAAAELFERQTWWIATAVATAIGLYLIMRRSEVVAVAIGVALLALPHAIGAPHPHEFQSAVPAELAGHFVGQSLAVHAVMWVLLAAVAGYVWQRLGGESRAPQDA